MSTAPKLTHDYLISKIDELPTLPTIVYELSQIISDPMSSTTDVEKIMQNDQSLTTKVLRLVNSAYYAIPGGVSNLGRAIAYIGFDTIHQLVLSASIISALDVKDTGEFDITQFWTHSVGVGIAAETIAKTIHCPIPADLFTCGLVHDMGKMALLSIDKASLVAITKKAEEEKLSYLEAENSLGIPAHTKIGQILGEKWRLPQQIQAVAQYHHQDNPFSRGGISGDLSKNVDVVFLANLLVHALKFGNSGHSKILGLPQEVIKRLAIDPQDGFKTLLKEVKINLEKAAEFIRVIGGS
ncbi:MAG: HDOD domain-containing protein [Bdellovibrionales bacterium]|nr:HDOD domain-containing protein [Bdellovibrionales bacterium]